MPPLLLGRESKQRKPARKPTRKDIWRKPRAIINPLGGGGGEWNNQPFWAGVVEETSHKFGNEKRRGDRSSASLYVMGSIIWRWEPPERRRVGGCLPSPSRGTFNLANQHSSFNSINNLRDNSAHSIFPERWIAAQQINHLPEEGRAFNR